MTRSMWSKGFLYALTLLTAMIAGEESRVLGQQQTGQLTDCQNAYGGTPTNAQCTAACNGIGCPGAWSWINPPNPTFQRCLFTLGAFQQGAIGPWVLGPNDSGVVSACGNSQTGATGANAVSYAISDTINNSQTVTLTSTVQVGVNAELVNAAGSLSASQAYTAGTATSSTVTKTYSCTCPAPPCGQVTCYLAVWSQTRAASGSVTFQWSGICSGCSNNWVNVGPSTTVNVSIGGTHGWYKCTTCELTCPAGDLASGCNGSSTTTPPNCNWKTPPS
jgi:hypothetical protein